MAEHVKAERPWLTKAKRKRLRYYRSSKAYLARCSEGLLVRELNEFRPTQIVSMPTISVSEPVTISGAYPGLSCSLLVADRATRGEASHEARAARRAREAGAKLSK